MENIIRTIDPNKPHSISEGDAFDDVPFLSYNKLSKQWEIAQ